TGNRVLADEVIAFTSRWASQGYPSELRMVTYYSPEKNQTFRFITNHMDIEPASLALLYLYRWEIEQFFKWIKQHLRIISFYGHSENAVIIQIYTAFTAYCLLALSAEEVRFKGSLYDFANLVSTCLTEKEWLDVVVKRHQGSDDVGICTEIPSLFDDLDY
ncbi:MAG: transposase, partial [Paramuribaculum sp.]|nr:transposase [Paramuribaculum sp.]